MAVSETEFKQAQARAAAKCQAGRAVTAHYDRLAARVVVSLDNGVQFALPVSLAEGLAGASPDDLSDIELTSSPSFRAGRMSN